MTTLDAARGYAALGLRLFPLKPSSKLPAITEWPTKATVDSDTVSGWWRGGDPRGIGLACGDELAPGRHHVVLDVDEHDPANSGTEALEDLERELGALPDTVTALTPTGGRHLHFVTDRALGNGAGSNLPTGLDIRGVGGFVVLPPSTHPAGGTYEWEADHAPGEIKIATLPEAWIGKLAHSPEPVERRRNESPRPVTPSVWDEIDTGTRPGDAVNELEWADILKADGWTHAGRAREGHDEWCRPGKDKRDGISATVGYGGSDVLKVFTSSVPGLDADATYTRFGYYTATRHGGDHSAAARALRDAQTPEVAPSMPPTPEGEEWPNPVPLGEGRDRPPFPVDVFPEWIRSQVEQVAEEMQLTPDLASMFAITALSIVAAGRIEVRVRGPWKEPANTYIVTALPPSAGKSPTMRSMLEPLDEWEARLIEEIASKVDEVETRRKIITKQYEKAVNSGETAEALALADELRELDPVVEPKLIADDVTPEKVAILLSEQEGRLAIVSAEGGLFSMMTGRYSDKANLDVYLQAWSRDTIRVDRVGRPAALIRRPTLTVGLAVQPSVIQALSENPELHGRGLVARFMYSIPADTVGARDLARESTYDDRIADRYASRLIGIAESLPEEQTTLSLSAGAVRAFNAWRQGHEARMHADGDLRHMAEWVTKLHSTTARVAALLHVAHGAYDGPIGETVMKAAISIGDYWEAHARLAHDLWGTDPVAVKANAILEAAVRHGVTRLTMRDAYVANRRLMPRVADTVEPLTMLVERGWLRPLFDGPITTGKRGTLSPTFEVNPTARNRAHGAHYDHAERSTTTENGANARMRALCLDTDLDPLSLSVSTYGDDTPESARNARNPLGL